MQHSVPNPPKGALGFALMLGLGVLVGGCDGAGDPTTPGATVSLRLMDLPAYDTAAVGPFAAWSIDSASQVTLLGRFAGAAQSLELTYDLEDEDPRALMITLEEPNSTSTGPSDLRIMGGPFVSDVAGLSVVGYLTPNLTLETDPGAHRLGGFEDLGGVGVLTAQDVGLWLIDPAGDTVDGSAYLDFTPLTAGWTYEGWVVRDWQTPDEVWLSYGKFLPDEFRQARFRDDTGLGPYSGRVDYVRALPEDVFVPGDDWVANPLTVPVPGGLSLPLDLNGCVACGQASRWTHVISIEPFTDRDEDPWAAVPFFLRPYWNPIGEADPEVPRKVLIRSQSLPFGDAQIVR